ncbi:hypothetical protein [Aquimarina sp. I32.4]|uniref:hypothetical protein n=1 Tax=Aquimarina sp. I32.4 TaxID=2053903 RepID=UPI000CDF17E9|nr:hypothetical protein [Aquimarina sp. I32.4]
MGINQTLSSLIKKDKIWIIITALAFAILGISNVLIAPAIDFLSTINGNLMLGLGIAIELKSITASISNAGIPFAGGFTTELSDILTRAINYLTFANIVTAVQTILANMGKSLLFKALPFFFLIGIFFKK